MVISMALIQDIPFDDVLRYRAMIPDENLSDGQKDEIILVIRNIMRTFVDRAFDIDPVQLSIAEKFNKSSREEQDSARILSAEDGHAYELNKYEDYAP